MSLDAPGGAWRITSEEVVARELLETNQPRFEVATDRTGIRDVHDPSGSPVFRLIGNMSASSGSAVGDYDGDGFEDLALLSASRLALYRNNADGSFSEVSQIAGFEEALGIAGSGLVFFDADNDGDPDLWVCGIRGERFFRNDNCGRFVDASASAGINETGWGLAGAWGDYNNDRYPDIYVGNEFGFKSLYRNNGKGTFTNVAAPAGALDRGAAMGMAWGDYDGDGNLDVYISNMYANSRWALFHPEFPPQIPWYLSWVPRSDIDSIVEENTEGSVLPVAQLDRA